MPLLPSFDPAEVELLIEAVQKALAHLKQANEQLGGSQRDILEAGRRYAVVLQKLEAVRSR